MSKNRRYKVEERVSKVAELYKIGMPQFEIAKRFDVTQQQISADIKNIIKRWKEESTEIIQYCKEIELEKINNIELEMWKEWKKTKKTGFGDSKYMAIIMDCIKTRIKILGIESNVNLTQNTQINIPPFIFE